MKKIFFIALFGILLVTNQIQAQETGTITDSRDGQIYNTVKIGNQWWMAENLNSTIYADGTPLDDGTGVGDISGDYTTKYYFYYNNDSATYADTYGALYTWAAVMNGTASSDNNPSGVQGVCPDGWHVPGDAEWKQLEMSLGMSQIEADLTAAWRGTDEGGKLKDTSTTNWDSPNAGATNESGFTALPGGYRGYDGTFFYINSDGHWWSAAENDATHSWFRRLGYNNSDVGRYDGNNSLGFSVRCVEAHTLYTDSLALVALYGSTDGASWTNNTNWLTGNVADWYGLTTSGDRVIEVVLDSNNLIGTIPSEIGDLTNLQILKLDHNQLSGSIPLGIGNLINLTELTLWENQLTGVIPSEIGNLSSLIILDLDVNLLSGEIPSEIGNLVNLEELWCSNNQLTGSIPSSIGSLTNLTALSIWENQLTGIIPTEIGNLTNLDTLHLGSNLLSGSIPTEIGNLTNLSFLYLGHNQFSGSIPSSIGNLSKLVLLSITDNQLTNSIPIEISSLDSLRILSLGGNQLSGSIPTELQNLSKLTELYLWGNQLTGTIPPEIGNLVNLELLYLWGNQLTGSIPTEIGNLSNLTKLSLSDNQLTGSIPSIIWNLTNLTYLRFDVNQLTGTIPPEIGNLTNLTYFSLYSNPLTGSIPTEIGNLTNLTELYLGFDQLTGSIPTEIGNLINLETLYLGYNQLSGSIPTEIGNLTNLTYLHLASNLLTSYIPSDIWDLTNLTYLNFHTNQLTGTIPTEIGNLSNLTSLRLYDNQLSGSFPTEIVSLTNLQRLDLYDNQFTDLPDFSSLIAMEYSQIQNNQFIFKDIEPNIGVPSITYTYSPQDSVGEIIDTTAIEGADITLSVSTGGASSQYQWKKDGSNIGSISTDSTFTINPIAFSDSGAYTCEITNTVATELTLYSRPINLLVDHTPFYKDSLALVALYDSTNGANWTNNTNWLTGPVSTWFGITVSGDRVTEINLENNNLTNSIPSEIGNLTNLIILNLHVNGLTGSIPPEIGNLLNITYLSFGFNQLSGTIPTEIGNLSYVGDLRLCFNLLTGSIPKEIGSLSNLNILTLANNQLEGSIPAEIWNLSNLTIFELYNNQLTGSIPSDIINLSNLTRLDLYNNQFTGSIPFEIGNLSNLTELTLFDNQFSGSIPAEIGNLTNLVHLDLSSNQLTGSIPTQIGTLTNLEYLNFGGNTLTGSIPTEIGNLTNLSILRFGDNHQLTGEIPSEIGNLTNLQHLDLSFNQLTAAVPNSFTNLTKLEILEFNYNQLTDLPDLSPCILLSELKINNNRFTFIDIEPNIGVASTEFIYSPQDSVGDRIDTTVYIGINFTLSFSTGGASSQYQWKKNGANIGSISAESTYTLNPVAFTDSGTYSCEITNTVATELTLYSRSVNVKVDYSPLQKDSLALVAMYDSTDGANWTDNTNWLTGSVSNWFGITVSGDRVTEISFDHNNLNGTIPTSIGDLDSLQILNLPDNQLSGTIRTKIYNLENLQHLNLNMNQLTGEISPEIGNLINLQGLHLSSNQLTGSIPNTIGNLINLTELIIEWNQLTGEIPPEIGNLTNLQNLSFWFNQLTGPIPPEIGNLTNLSGLTLMNNKLSGSIPSEIGNITNLQTLWLHSNNLTGSIPSSTVNLTNLESLSLYENQLSGSIPTEIVNLTYLRELSIYTNQFTGLPNLSSLDSLDYLSTENNKFTFKDIEPNIGVPSTTYTYSPQDSVGEIIDTTAYLGTDFTLSVSTGGASSQYQWKKDGANIGSISADSTFAINTVAFSDSGTYSCEITNTVATELTLYSRPINVIVDYTPFYKDSLALVALYDSTDGANWTNNTNWLTGPVSNWFGITVFDGRVTEIYFDRNNLNGHIPPEIGNLTNLTFLTLEEEQLSGQIPTEICKLTNLTTLRLYNSQLSGSIPLEIGNLTNLTFLDFNNNQLTGPIPIEIGNLINLTMLYFDSNNLTGSIPIEIGNLVNLTHLLLQGNQLSGSIPATIGNLLNLEALILEWNQLSGSIPAELWNLTNLQSLKLSDNQFVGTLPPEIGNLINLTDLIIYSNSFSGEIPMEIQTLNNLSWLWLYDNEFTDLPDLSSLTSLAILRIQGNKFSFEDIEPNIGVASTEFVYSPQDSIGMPQDTVVSPCSSFTVSVSVGGSNNQYQWQKDGTNIMDADSSAYIISFITPSDSGTYICEITNSIATELTLYSRPINVTVGPLLNLTSEYSDTICLNSNKGYIDISVTGGTSPYFYAWSNGSSNEDVYDLEADEYTVTVTDYNNCTETETITIASTNTCPTEEICMVTVDNSNMNLIIWEKTQDEGIVLYKIYRETVNDGVYEIIGTVPYEDLSIFVDPTSNPDQKSYKYKLSIIDTCGIVSEKSYYHGTMFLQVSVGAGANNLDWTNYEYEGGDFNFSKFYIYRGSTKDNLQKIDSIGANYNTYIDNDPPDGLIYYQVAGVKPDACFPTANKKNLLNDNYALSFTNIFNYGVTGLDNIDYSNRIKIYPNPFTNKTTIEFPNSKIDSYTLTITNISGTTVKIIKNIKTGKVELERGTLQEGLYLIELRGDKIYKGKFIIE